MYIDEKLIEILEPHRGETIDVGYMISLIKTIAKEHETEQLSIHNVVGRSEQLVSFLRQYQKSCEIMHVNKIDAKNFVEQYKTN